MNDAIAIKKLTVDIQENGIIRAPNGRLIARLVNDIKFDSEHLEQRQKTRPHETVVIGEIESHIESMIIEAKEHAKMGDYAKALSLKEQTTGFKRAIDVIRKHLSQ